MSQFPQLLKPQKVLINGLGQNHLDIFWQIIPSSPIYYVQGKRFSIL